MLHEPADHTNRVRLIYEDLLGRFPRPDRVRHAFANVGHVAEDDDGQSPSQAARSRALLHRALGAVEPTDGRLLDVGCGRGGNLREMSRHFGAGTRCVGLELTRSGAQASAAIVRPASIVQGDAHHLPFEDKSLGLVTCIESAHAYEDASHFHDEVARVVGPDGSFVLVDFVVAEAHSALLASLESSGLRVEHDEDLTDGVLRSLDCLAAELDEVAAARTLDDRVKRYAALPGSALRLELESGRVTYRAIRSRRTSPAACRLRGAREHLGELLGP